MRTAQANPALKQFGHLLPENGRYPAKWVDIFWNTNDEMKVKDVEVVFVPRGGPIGDGEESEEFWARFAHYNRGWMADLGNSCADWLEPGGITPAWIFGDMLQRGFVTKADELQALKEFAHIAECQWARDMLDAYQPPKD